MTVRTESAADSPALACDLPPVPGRAARTPQNGLSLRSNFGWTLAGNLLYAASQWGFLIVLAKLLDPAAVGRFAFALAVTAPIIIFANQGLTALQATDAHGEFTFRDYFSCRVFTTAIALIVICILSLLLHWPSVVLVVAGAKAAEALCDIRYGFYQRSDRMDRTAKSMILRGTLSLLFAAALLYVWRSVAWAAAGLLLSNVTILLAVDYRAQLASIGRVPDARTPRHHSRRSLRRSPQAALLVQAFPLGLAAMLSSLTSSIPRYFIEHYNGAALLGIFAALMYLLVAGRTLVTALAQSCVAPLSRYYAQGEKAFFSRLLLRQMLVGLALGVAGIGISALAGRFLLRLLYRPEYAAYANVLLLVMCAAALNYMAEFSNGGLLAVRSIKVQPVILALCTVLILVLSLVLIPRFGIVGASWAVLITGAFQLAANLYCLGAVQFPKPGSALATA